MNLSYENNVIRDYCYSTNPNLSNSRFNISEIQVIRSYIADLRAAPSLADVPIDYSFVPTNDERSLIKIQFSNIVIQCQIISLLKKPYIHEIQRIKVIDIFKNP